MERAIAEMEKIKRAEEIYSRRKNLDDEQKKPKSRNIYKNLFEILLLINIVIIIVAIQNQKYIFTPDFIKQVNSYNINIKSKFEEIFTNSSKEEKTSKKKEENTETSEENGVSGESNDVNSAILVDNEPEENIESEPEPVQELSQEDKDVIEIKNNYSVILPVSGTKTSGFGIRESTNKKVTKNHTGVDIGAVIRNNYKFSNNWKSYTSL